MARLFLRVAGWGDDIRKRSHDKVFLIEEYRRPEYEVKVDVDAGPHFVEGDATATVSAKYYAGGGLPNADVKWTATARPATFRPPRHDDFCFGRFRPFWISEYNAYDVSSQDEEQAGRMVLPRVPLGLGGVRPARSHAYRRCRSGRCPRTARAGYA